LFLKVQDEFQRLSMPMKSHRKELWFDVPQRRAFFNITPEVERCLAESGVREGLCLVNAMHISKRVAYLSYS
jgi:thiamine phosphate synthase YjbQ (UPF0047 family)